MIPLLAAGLLWFPVLLPLYDGLGNRILTAAAVLLGCFFSLLLPAAAASGPGRPRAVAFSALALALVSAAVAARSPLTTPEAPGILNFELHQDVAEPAPVVTRWFAYGTLSGLPPSVLQAGNFAARPVAPYPWSPPAYPLYVAAAPRFAEDPPRVEVVTGTVQGGKRQVRIRLQSVRGADAAFIYIPEAAKPENVMVDGHPVAAAGEPLQAAFGWYSLALVTLQQGGVELDLLLGETRPLEWVFFDRTPGLPPAGAKLIAARTALRTAVPGYTGDTTLVSVKRRI